MSSKLKSKSITEFLGEEYKEYSMYVIENRAIPSVIDGFKASQRKVMYAASMIWKNGNDKDLRVFQFAGRVASDTYYHHGNVSLEDTIVGMVQKFKNNAPLLLDDGQFGDLRSPKAAASRYIGTKLSPNFKLIYKDSELLEHKYEDGNKIEPKYFLPIIPMVLVNGTSGIAVGFKTMILNRNIKDVCEGVISHLKGKKIKTLVPSTYDFSGEFEVDPENNKRWISKGRYTIDKNKVHITELPPSESHESYEEYLDKLCDSKKIMSYVIKDRASISIEIKFKELPTIENIDKLLRINQPITEIFNTLDEHGKLKIFDSAEEILKYFTDYRLEKYNIRKEHKVNKLNRQLLVLNNKLKFIELIIKGKIKVNNVKRDLIIEQIVNNGIEKVDDSYSYLINIPIYSLTVESIESIKKEISDIEKDLEETIAKDIKELYIEEVEELKRKI